MAMAMETLNRHAATFINKMWDGANGLIDHSPTTFIAGGIAYSATWLSSKYGPSSLAAGMNPAKAAQLTMLVGAIYETFKGIFPPEGKDVKKNRAIVFANTAVATFFASKYFKLEVPVLQALVVAVASLAATKMAYDKYLA